MDPNETLRMIRRLVMLLENCHTGAGVAPSTVARWGEELAEYTGALDQWLSKGGFAPRAWDHS